MTVNCFSMLNVKKPERTSESHRKANENVYKFIQMDLYCFEAFNFDSKMFKSLWDM